MDPTTDDTDLASPNQVTNHLSLVTANPPPERDNLDHALLPYPCMYPSSYIRDFDENGQVSVLNSLVPVVRHVSMKPCD